MNIAIAQINTRMGDFAQTCARMSALSHAAEDQGADMIVFPTTVLTGQYPVEYPDREGFQFDLLRALDRLAMNLALPALVPVLTEMDHEPYHEVMLISSGSVMPLRAQSFLEVTERGEGTDGRSTRSQGAPPFVTTFELGDMDLAVALTYEDLDDLLDAPVDVDAVIYFSDYSYALDDPSSALGSALAENRFKADAVALDAWFVAVGSVGGNGLQTFTGASFVLSPQGELTASAPAFDEALLQADIDCVDESYQGMDAAAVLEPELYNRTLHLWEALSMGLRDYVDKRDLRDVALMLDGSLASCLLAVLASDAVGPTHVQALLCAPHDQRARIARNTAEALHLEATPFDAPHVAKSDPRLMHDMAQAYVAGIARRTGAVLLSSEDKTFLALEASQAVCKAAELLPFGDVYRTDLMELAHMRNTISPIVPQEAFRQYVVPEVPGLEEAEPSPEMRLKRVDVTLATYLEWERPVSDVAARQGMPEVTEAVIARLHACQVARSSWPPCLVVSSKPLFMVRIPFVCGWSDHVREEEERLHGHDVVRGLLPRRPLRAKKISPDEVPSAAVPEDYSNLLEGLELELQSGNLPAGAGKESVEGALGELMGLLQDLLQNGEQPPSVEGPFGPLTWGSPFSEN